MRSRAGVTLVECMVALALGGLVSAAVGSVLVTQNRLLRDMSVLAADIDARRIAMGVLRAELRWIDPYDDVRSVAGDSIAVRLYRGGGSICEVTADRLLVRYEGARLPAPGKDSALVRTGAGEYAYALAGFEDGTSCHGHPALWLHLEAAPPGSAAFVLLFESGTYYMRDRALRYRVGREGRQPVTDERFAARLPPVALDEERTSAVVPLAWPAASHRPLEALRIWFANAPR